MTLIQNNMPRERHSETKARPSRQTSSDTTTTISANNQDAYLHGIGPYEFTKLLGSGKFSRVMLAFHLETQQQVAIKVKKIKK
jgi:serine/threonine protein kinase